MFRELRDFFRSLLECFFGKRCSYCGWRRANEGVVIGFASIHFCSRCRDRAEEDIEAWSRI